MIEINKIYNMDCLELMKEIPDGSVDLMLTDIPYGITKNEWDILPDLSIMWKEWLRMVKQGGAMIFTGSQPMTSELIMSNKKHFRYELIWKKNIPTQFLDANKRPLKIHENILIFYTELPIYNPQYTKGKAYSTTTKGTTTNYGKFDIVGTISNGDRFPVSVLEFDCETGHHPTQKPIDLFRYLIKTYSNEGDLVYDGYMGSGTTAIAAIMEKRNYIGAELSKEYFDIANKRISNLLSQPTLF